jgi:hypothetical protein
VNDQKFFNPNMAQTLVSLQMLLYLEAFFTVLAIGQLGGFGIPLIVSTAGGAYGVANERKWGYILAIVAVSLFAGGYVILPLAAGWYSISDLLGFPTILTVLIAAVLVVLVFHPESRDYQRIWFK